MALGRKMRLALYIVLASTIVAVLEGYQLERVDAFNQTISNGAALGLSGEHSVRDLWRERDLGTFSGSFTARVPRHGVSLVAFP